MSAPEGAIRWGKPGQEDGNRTGVIKMEHLENINYEYEIQEEYLYGKVI